MLKKALIGVGVLLAGSVLFYTTDLGSYACTLFKSGKEMVKKQVPTGFEIKRAKDMLANIDKVDDKLITAMAKEMVAIKHLEREIATAEKTVEDQRKDIVRRNDHLKTLTVSKEPDRAREQFALELERSFKRFKTLEVSLKSKKELMVEHNQRLNATREQREGLKAQKADLAARIENLETQLEVLKAAQSRSRVVLDNGQLSELSKITELVDRLEKRVDTDMTELNLREEIKSAQPTAPVVNTSTSIVQEIDSYFGSDAGVAAGK